MTFEYSEFWFILMMIVAFIFISLVILFAFQIAYSTDIFIQDYEDCIAEQIPSYICDEMFPSIPLQAV
jgi:cell division protein FtsL